MGQIDLFEEKIVKNIVELFKRGEFKYYTTRDICKRIGSNDIGLTKIVLENNPDKFRRSSLRTRDGRFLYASIGAPLTWREKLAKIAIKVDGYVNPYSEPNE